MNKITDKILGGHWPVTNLVLKTRPPTAVEPTVAATPDCSASGAAGRATAE